MKFNKLVVAILWATAVSGLAQNNIGTLVTDPVRPFSVNSTHPSAIANEIKGGPFVSSNLAGLSNIPAPRLEIVAIGYATNTGLYYRLTATSPATWSSINGANLTNIQASNLVGTITTNLGIQFDSITATNGESTFEDLSFLDEIDGPQATFGTNTNIVIIGSSGISFGSSSVAETTRTNLGLGVASSVQFSNLTVFGSGSPTNLGIRLGSTNYGLWGSGGPPSVGIGINGTNRFEVNEVKIIAGSPIEFAFTNHIAPTRTNLGLGWSGLTNTQGSALVAVNTNGDVVSPTNFWQVAPIVTRFVEFDPATNATTNIVAARNLHIHSLAISRTGVTSTITLPTNGVFNGDIALVVHQGPTSSVTRARTAGSTNDLVTMNRFDESVEFVYYNNVWQFNHNRSFIEPIYFSGTNTAANAAASRTNLGLGWLALTSPQSSLYSGTATTLLGYVAEINPNSTNLTGFNVLAYTNTNTLVVPANLLIAEDAVPAPRNARNVTVQGSVTIRYPFSSPTTIYANNSITATDESSYTNTLVSFGSNNVVFSNVTASGTLTATGVVTAATNLVVDGFVDFTTNRAATNGPTNAGNFNTHAVWITIKAGTNTYFLPAYK